ncbi:MAG: hypothetical protein II563_11545, partial [Treponema sp.]|nr:hypothetical protein [Treponema sp.]
MNSGCFVGKFLAAYSSSTLENGTPSNALVWVILAAVLFCVVFAVSFAIIYSQFHKKRIKKEICTDKVTGLL